MHNFFSGIICLYQNRKIYIGSTVISRNRLSSTHKKAYNSDNINVSVKSNSNKTKLLNHLTSYNLLVLAMPNMKAGGRHPSLV